ncbi:MAG: DUF465 domain-containing protein [Alphaproteobacteria bacterium]
MGIQSHLSELERRHAALDRQLSDLISHPSAADVEIADVKRRKLLLKDQITRLKQSKPKDPSSSLH